MPADDLLGVTRWTIPDSSDLDVGRELLGEPVDDALVGLVAPRLRGEAAPPAQPTQGTRSSRVFQSRPRTPPGRSTRRISRAAGSGSNQWAA